MVTKSPASQASKSTAVTLEKSPAPVSLTKTVPAGERLAQVLKMLGRTTAKSYEPADILWGRAIALAGGGSVYINRSNADVRSTTKQVSDWSKSIKGSTIRGAQGQYLRIAF